MLSINSLNIEKASFLYSTRGILLGEGAEVDGFAEAVHGVKMLLPEAVDGVQDDVALEAAEGFGVFHGGPSLS